MGEWYTPAVSALGGITKSETQNKKQEEKSMKKRVLSCVLSVALLVCMTVPFIALPVSAEIPAVLTKDSTGVSIIDWIDKGYANTATADLGAEKVFTDLGKNLLKNATLDTGSLSGGLTDFKGKAAPGPEYVDETATIGNIWSNGGKARAFSKLSDDRVGAYSGPNPWPCYRINKVGFSGSSASVTDKDGNAIPNVGGYAAFSVKLNTQTNIEKILVTGSASDDRNTYAEVRRFFVYASTTNEGLFDDANMIVNYDNSADLSYGMVIDLTKTLGAGVDALYVGFKVSTAAKSGDSQARIDEIGVYAKQNNLEGVTLFDAPVDQKGAAAATIGEWDCFKNIGTNLLVGSSLLSGTVRNGLTDFKGFAAPDDSGTWVDETKQTGGLGTAAGAALAISKLWDNKAGSYSPTKPAGSVKADGTVTTGNTWPCYRNNCSAFNGNTDTVQNKAGTVTIAGKGWAQFSFKLPKTAQIDKVMVSGSQADDTNNRFTYRFRVFVGNNTDTLFNEDNMVIDYDNSVELSYGVIVDLTKALGAKVRTGRFVGYRVCAGTTDALCRLDELGVYGTQVADPDFTVTEITSSNYVLAMPSVDDNLLKDNIVPAASLNGKSAGEWANLTDGYIKTITPGTDNIGTSIYSSGAVTIDGEAWPAEWSTFGFDLGDAYNINKLLVAGSPSDGASFNYKNQNYDNKNVRYLEVYVSDDSSKLFTADNKVLTFDNRVDPICVFTLDLKDGIHGRYVGFHATAGAYGQLRLQELGIYGTYRGAYFGVADGATIKEVTAVPTETSLIEGLTPISNSKVSAGKIENVNDGNYPGLNQFVMPLYEEDGTTIKTNQYGVITNANDINGNLQAKEPTVAYDLGTTTTITDFVVGSTAEGTNPAAATAQGMTKEALKEWYLTHQNKYVRLHRGAFYVSDSADDLFDDANKVTYWDYTLEDALDHYGAQTPLVAKYTLNDVAVGRYVGFKLYTVGVSDTNNQWGWWDQVRIGELAVFGEASATATLGGQIRSNEDGVAALRFGFDAAITGLTVDEEYHTTDLTEGKVVIGGQEYDVITAGILVGRDDLSEDADFVVGGANGDVVDVEAKKIYESRDKGVTFTAVVVNIPEAHFATQIKARSYVAYNDGVETKYVYSDIISRSINDLLPPG